MGSFQVSTVHYRQVTLQKQILQMLNIFKEMNLQGIMAINVNKLVTSDAFPDKIFEVNAWVLQSFLYKQFIFMLCPKYSTWLQDGFCE